MRAPGIYKNIPIEEYHAEEGISSTGISLIMDCPKRYWWEFVSGSERHKKAKQYEMGSALHTCILEPDKFQERFYLARETFDMRTKAGKEAMAKAEEEANGKIILRGVDCELLLAMECSVKEHSIWQKIKLNEGNIESSIYWDGGIYKTRLRSRPDFFNEDVVIDLKTTDCLSNFSKSVYNLGYHRQAVMQLDGLKKIDGRNRYFAFFVVEKKPPYLTACFTLDEAALKQGRKEYLNAAAVYSECLKANEWPGYEEKIQILSLPKWATEKEETENV